MSDRVKRPAEYSDVLKALTEEKLFPTMKDALIFCACLGYKHGKRLEFSKSDEPIGLHIFKGEFDEAVINCIALAETNRPEVMASDKNKNEEKIKIFEEYACGGLSIVKSSILDSGVGDLETQFSQLILNERSSGSSGLINDITGIRV